MATSDSMHLHNISPEQGRLRQVVGWTLTIVGVAVGIALARGDSGLLVRLLPVAAIMWGTSWIFGGRAEICAVDATRGREHPEALLSFGVGGDVVADDERAEALRRVARQASIKAGAVGLALSLLVLLL